MSVTNQSWLDAQYSVLGSALIEPKVVSLIMAETQESDFSGPCRTVYQTISDVFNSGFPVDVVSVASKLPNDYREFLAQLMEITPTAANVGTYIAICREQSRVLSCREIGKELSACEDSKTARSLVEEASKMMSSVQSNRAASMESLMRRFYERAEKPVRYLSWPIRELESELHVGAGKFMILGAEPSVGKTAFALQCAWHWASAGKIGFFSFETDPDTLFDRLISSFTGIPMESIKTNRITRKEWDAICQASQAITQRKLELISAAGMTVSDIRAKIMESGYKVVIIDYLQIVSAKGGSRYEQVTNISIDLHTMAQSLGVIVLALAQLSRSEGDRVPKNSDLRESGQIEQDADLILMLQLAKQSCPEGPRNLYVTKNKEGRLFQMLLTFDGRHQAFAKGGALDAAVAEASAMKKKHKGGSPPPVPSGPVPGQLEMLSADTDVPFKD
jgi:replicative DNA helicase